MRRYIFVGIGAFCGACARYGAGVLFPLEAAAFPFRTMTVNLLGSFVLAFFLTAALEVSRLDPDLRLGVSSGFLGAFTTFSAFCKEAVLLMETGLILRALAYMLLSAALGLMLAWLGVSLGHRLHKKEGAGQ